MQLPYTVVVEQVDDYYLARIVELSGCQTTADTLEEVLEEIEQVKLDYLKIKIRFGDPIPEPGKNKNE